MTPSPGQIDKAATVLRALAKQEQADDDRERAKLLDRAAEICEAKAFVGQLAKVVLERKA